MFKSTDKKVLNYCLIGLVVLVVGYFVYKRFASSASKNEYYQNWATVDCNVACSGFQDNPYRTADYARDICIKDCLPKKADAIERLRKTEEAAAAAKQEAAGQRLSPHEQMMARMR